MYTFLNPNISIATVTDLPALKGLLNIAYRGDASKQGWTTEAHLIAGDTRTDDTMLLQTIEQAGSIFLKYTLADNRIVGCVNLQQHGKRLYLGMFSVLPQMQGGGFGKHLLLAAEEYAKHVDSRSIYMSVISVRTELIQWYMRYGYKDTGERKPFLEDEITGKHLQTLEFMILEKTLSV